MSPAQRLIPLISGQSTGPTEVSKNGFLLVELIDKVGEPFILATPEPVLVHLHHIDRDAADQIRTPEATPVHESRNREHTVERVCVGDGRAWG